MLQNRHQYIADVIRFAIKVVCWGAFQHCSKLVGECDNFWWKRLLNCKNCFLFFGCHCFFITCLVTEIISWATSSSILMACSKCKISLSRPALTHALRMYFRAILSMSLLLCNAAGINQGRGGSPRLVPISAHKPFSSGVPTTPRPLLLEYIST